MGFRLSSRARLELLEATEWYASRSAKVARGFLAEYRRTRSRITTHPRRWPVLEGQVRSLAFRRYPYSLLYIIEDDHVLVLALKHHRRAPGYWKDQ